VAHTVPGSCGSGGSAASTVEETPFDPVEVPPVPVDVPPVPVEVPLVPVDVPLVPVDVLPVPDEVVPVAVVLPLELEFSPALSPPPHALKAMPAKIDTHSSFVKPGIVFSKKIKITGTSASPIQ